MEPLAPPRYIDVFISPLRDNATTQILFVAFVLLMVLDVVLGYAAAAKEHDVRSSKMREGLWHKTGELGIVAVGDVLDGMMLGGVDLSAFGIDISAPIMAAFLLYLAVNEAVSCMENACKLDPELATKRFFRSVRSALGDGEEVEDSDE